MWLDSCVTGDELGRYDIIVARPHTTLVCRGEETEISSGGNSHISREDPFNLLRQQLAMEQRPSPQVELPFCGGAVGYYAYDLARRVETLPSLAEDDLGMPDMAVGIYDWAMVCDHQQQSCYLQTEQRHPATQTLWSDLIELFEDAAAYRAGEGEITVDGLAACGKITSNMSRADYRDGFARIQHYLQEGDCYQVNFAQRFSLPVSGSPWGAYLKLRQSNPSPFGAYLNTPYGQILSSSPERFLKLDDGRVETRPIKGTRPRRDRPDEDEAMAQELKQSSKDRAENLMIVDLLRNDLGKCCLPGSIKVPHLFAIEHFPTVHHMVSVIEGALAPNEDALSLLRNCFPGGSITGAPKLRAMQIIEELEPHRRGIYCGSIGYIGFNGNMDSNIAIRTLLHKDGHSYFSAGGGIVRDSVCDEEYQETYDKAAALLGLFEG